MKTSSKRRRETIFIMLDTEGRRIEFSVEALSKKRRKKLQRVKQ